ncbi:MAG: winged helix-turn-helix transcriptional regulator [Alphaproteobacteria bacterium]|nr:winged helix-turn-helix transcriptional regulator [Alphaproteobacteria bacterium]
MPTLDKLLKAKNLLKSLSNERRLLLLCQLTDGEKNVTELGELVGISQSSISQHLARLRADGLVKTRRASQTIYYSLNGPEAIALIATLHKIYCVKKSLKRSKQA